jgi:hypothetical protein
VPKEGNFLWLFLAVPHVVVLDVLNRILIAKTVEAYGPYDGLDERPRLLNDPPHSGVLDFTFPFRWGERLGGGPGVHHDGNA